MNSELRKAIEKATQVQVLNDGFCHDTVDVVEHEAAQAKLLRVIELLVEQRDVAVGFIGMYEKYSIAETNEKRVELDAELIAALEGT